MDFKYINLFSHYSTKKKQIYVSGLVDDDHEILSDLKLTIFLAAIAK